MKNNKEIYQLTVKDLQNVAHNELDRLLTDDEISIISDRLGDYIGWYDAILSAINDTISRDKT
jgi:hypothetical protein